MLYLLRHVAEAYAKAPAEARRLLNQTLFERLLVETETIGGADIADPFAAVLAHDLIKELESKGQDAKEPGTAHRGQGSNELRLAPLTARYSNHEFQGRIAHLAELTRELIG